MAKGADKATVNCPHCGNAYPIDHEKIGKAGVFCDSCKRVFSSAPAETKNRQKPCAPEAEAREDGFRRRFHEPFRPHSKQVSRRAEWAFWLGLVSVLGAGLVLPGIAAGVGALLLAKNLNRRVDRTSRLGYWLGLAEAGALLAYVGIFLSVCSLIVLLLVSHWIKHFWEAIEAGVTP